VLEVLEKGDLSDGCAGCALLVLQPDLLQGHQVVRQPGLPLEHRRVRALNRGVENDARQTSKSHKTCVANKMADLLWQSTPNGKFPEESRE